MLRRHFFLFGALGLLGLMLVLAVLKIAGGALGIGKPAGGQGGGQAAAKAAGGPAGKMGGARRGAGGGFGGPSQVTAAVVTMRPFTDSVEVIGVAKGRQSVTLTSNNTELVTRVRFHDGEHVPRGAVLVELQAREEDASIIQAQAALAQAKGNYGRWKQLYDRGIAAKASLEQYQSLYEQAQASLQAAQSRRLDRMIRAPFSGVVGLSDIAPGALISPGTPIATLDDLTVIRVDFPVPDRYLPLLKVGAPISARPDAFAGAPVAGRIAQVDTRVDERTRAVVARAEFPNSAGLIKPGMQMRVSIEQGVRQAVAAPEAAIQFEGDQASVYVVGKRGEQAIAEQRVIQIGVRDGGFVEVLNGLKPGDTIVADGLNKVSANQPIRIAGAVGSGRPQAGGSAAR